MVPTPVLELEEKLIAIWSEYLCLYDVRNKEFKNRDKRDVAMKEIGAKLESKAKKHFGRNMDGWMRVLGRDG